MRIDIDKTATKQKIETIDSNKRGKDIKQTKMKPDHK